MRSNWSSHAWKYWCKSEQSLWKLCDDLCYRELLMAAYAYTYANNSGCEMSTHIPLHKNVPSSK